MCSFPMPLYGDSCIAHKGSMWHSSDGEKCNCAWYVVLLCRSVYAQASALPGHKCLRKQFRLLYFWVQGEPGQTLVTSPHFSG